MVPSSSSFSPRHDGALEQPLPDPSLAPAAEPLPHRVAVAEFNRQVSPGKTGPQQGVYPAQKAAVTPFAAAPPDPPNRLYLVLQRRPLGSPSICLVMDVAPLGSIPQGATSIY